MNILTSIKSIVAAGAVLAGFIVCPPNANAWLGDTYAVSVRSLGHPDSKTGAILWWRPVSAGKTWLGETFYHNQCVAVFYQPAPGDFIYESELWRLLQTNSRPGTIWEQYGSDSDGLYYRNQERTLFAVVVLSGRLRGGLRICYRSYLDRHGFWDRSNENERPPVEDSANDGEVTINR